MAENKEQAIRDIIARQAAVRPEQVKDDLTLSALDLDSLDIFEIIITIEDCLNLDIPDQYIDSDLEQTVGAFIKRVLTKGYPGAAS